VELSDTFASYVGWILPVATPLVLVLPEPDRDAADEAVDQLVRIGFDRLVGQLDGGIDRWLASGRAVARMETITSAELATELATDGRSDERPIIVDVRDPEEVRDDGRVEDAAEVPLAGIIAGLDLTVPDGAPVTVACKSGARASVAAGLLEARGHPVRLVVHGGIPDVAARLARAAEPASE
jgi:rhodanese-related sulfurtransferase